MKIIDVEPAGRKKGMAFVECADRSQSGLREVEYPVYPDSSLGRALRVTRQANGIGLRKAADILGITAMQLSGLEGGSMRCEVSSDMNVLIAKLAVKGRR